MDINWFPGHMAKSTREIEANLKASDCVVYVLDARAVRSCFNPNFDRIINVPIVYVLNKADTVPAETVNKWVSKLSTDKTFAVATEGTSVSCRKKLLAAIKNACAEKLERQKRRGLNSHIRAMVVGVPNTGKSTLINSLCGRVKSATGDKAGVTRNTSWVRADETLDLLDTPGTLYPKITDRKTGENLAIIGCIRDEVLDPVELASALIDRLNAIGTNILKERFGAEIENENGLYDIAKARGYKMRGDEYDIERAAKSLIDDFRKCRLGKIALETV